VSLPDTPIALIGIGLIGSSMAHGLARAGHGGEVRLFDASPDVRAAANGAVPGRVCATLADAVSGAGIVVLCTPPGIMGAVAADMAAHLAPGAVVTDVGSVKRAVIGAVLPVLPPHAFLVPAHPIAGTEQSGPLAGFAGLFDGRWAILTPLEDARPEYAAAVRTVEALWVSLGCAVETMAPDRHDLVLAMTSHVPHLIAFSVVATSEDLESVTESEVVKYSAGGFRDFTRIAASDPTMWRDVFLLNRDAMLELLGRVSEDITALRRAIRWGDGQMLFDTFTRARRMRREVIEAGQDVDQVNFGRAGQKPD
jgi:cyclohexadieny/prephenate dehydrogenase